MRAWQIISFSGCIASLLLACGGESATPATMSGESGASGSGGTSSATAGAAGDSSGASGSSNGGEQGAGGSPGTGGVETSDASSGAGGAETKDASATKDATGTIRDAASERTAIDGACTEGVTDRCDTCTDARCCTQVDACEANAACKAAFAKLDACVGDAGTLARVRNCYTAFEQTNNTGGTARNLSQCVANRCTNQCRL
jgi:hypothetical protein